VQGGGGRRGDGGTLNRSSESSAWGRTYLMTASQLLWANNLSFESSYNPWNVISSRLLVACWKTMPCSADSYSSAQKNIRKHSRNMRSDCNGTWCRKIAVSRIPFCNQVSHCACDVSNYKTIIVEIKCSSLAIARGYAKE